MFTGRMSSLRELYLSNNQLGIEQTVDWRWLLGPQVPDENCIINILM